jgi:hypothetical protein
MFGTPQLPTEAFASIVPASSRGCRVVISSLRLEAPHVHLIEDSTRVLG